MNFPENVMYSKSHEWVQYLDGGRVRIGLSDFAQHELGDIVFITLPEVGEELEAGARLGDVESVKAVSDILCPVSGKVVAVNEALNDEPGKLNEDPYGAWVVELSDVVKGEPLMDATAYRAEVDS